MNTASVPFIASIEQDLKRLEERLLAAVLMAHSPIGDRLHQLVRAGGKRLRPSLTMYAGYIFDADPDRVLSVASGIELLHTASLVHDDLVDNAQERRGVPTLNSSFPMGLVVLSGDLLFAEAARLVAEADHVGVVRSFARALSEICHGELLQAQTKHTLVSPEEYYQRIYGKTGSLFRTASEAGAMLGTDDPELIEAMSEYGRLLGMAFQIVDDALDFTGKGDRLGKPSGHDLREGIISLPVLLYHARSDQLNGTFKRVIAGRATEQQITATIEDIRASGAVDEALEIAHDFSRQAREQLRIVPARSAREALINLTHFAVNRDY
jgi:geranylgeranyl pyrophosphate synthase